MPSLTHFFASIDELVELLMHKFDAELTTDDEDVFKIFAPHLVQALYSVTRNVREFEIMAPALFEKFKAPLQGKLIEQLTPKQKIQLFINIKGDLRTAVQNIYSMNFSAAELKQEGDQQKQPKIQQAQSTASSSIFSNSPSNTLQQQLASNNDFDIPVLGRYVLLASFLASYNPPSYDNTYFASADDGFKKARKQKNNSTSKKGTIENRRAHDIPLERLVTLCEALVQNRETPIQKYFFDDLNDVIKSLISMNLLVRKKKYGDLDIQKFGCAINYEYASKLAVTVGVQLQVYMK